MKFTLEMPYHTLKAMTEDTKTALKKIKFHHAEIEKADDEYNHGYISADEMNSRKSEATAMIEQLRRKNLDMIKERSINYKSDIFKQNTPTEVSDSDKKFIELLNTNTLKTAEQLEEVAKDYISSAVCREYLKDYANGRGIKGFENITLHEEMNELCDHVTEVCYLATKGSDYHNVWVNNADFLDDRISAFNLREEAEQGKTLPSIVKTD